MSSEHTPYLRNVNNGRVFPYSETLAKFGHLVPYHGEVSDKGTVVDQYDIEVSAEEAPVPPSKTRIKLAPEDPTIDDQTLMTLHWTKLKKLVEEHGGIYTSRNDAVAYLDAKGVTL